MTDGVYVMRHLDCDENTRDRFRFKVLNRRRIMISPSIARAVCGGREGGGIELDHFSYSQVQIIYCNESAIFLSTLKYQAHRCPAADLKYKNL